MNNFKMMVAWLGRPISLLYVAFAALGITIAFNSAIAGGIFAMFFGCGISKGVANLIKISMDVIRD